MAISPPVLPAETAAWAWPSFTASTAFHMLVPLPRRMATAGFSSMATAVSVWRISQACLAAPHRASSGAIFASSPWSRNFTPG
ncbi:hypothetical protein D3C83_57150 [compost metagenome]